MIRLKIKEDNIKLKAKTDPEITFKVNEGIPIYPSPYSRQYIVTPSSEEQTLETEGLMMTHNVIINPIPSNYGLITWNGSYITVS